ncbi:MAG: C25 family cysteine peptidase [Oligoflexia bacterium]|nr:C25 family cysteine peptidase [Oligoflexia bacterium]
MLSDFPGNLLIANTGPVGDNVVSIDANSKINGSVTLSSGILRVNSGTTLTVLGNVSVGSGATLDIEAGGTLRLGNGSVLTVESGGTLELVGTGSQNAVISSTATTNAFTAVVNGTIKARYYSLSRLGATGLTISSGATIDPTYHLQDGSFSYPVPSGATFLRLYRQVPTDTMNDCSFDAGGSAATGITNVFTDPSIASDGANTLTLSSFAGTWAGSTYDNDSAAYALSWTAPTNTIDLTQESAGPASVNQGQSYTMGRFGFKQTQAGAFFQDTDLTSLKLTLQGTATSSDISQVRAYFDSDCNSSAGTLIGTGTFSGNPATVTFAIAAGAATIPASLTAPAKRCIYVVYDIGAEAVNGNTVGAKIHASTDVANSRGYEISGTTPPPVTLGTPASVVGTTTTWTGLLSNDWFSAGNWNGGVPTANLNCKIFSAANAPVISAPGAVCKSLTLGTGSLTLTNGAGATLDIYGSFASTGTFTQNDGVLRLRDDGATATNQSLGSSTALTSIAFNKTAGGSVSVDSANLTLNSFTLPAATSFEWRVPSGKTLILPNGATISGGTFNVQGGGTVRVGDTKLITVSGGTFRISGTNDVYAPESGLQALTNKGTITVSGSGRWGFNATSGTVNLVGFLLDYLDINGLRISGSTTLANLSGGQFTHLVQNWVTPVKALQLNTSGTVPATATNVGFMWDDANSYQAEAGWCNCAPAPASSYYLVYAPACGGAGISFDQWFGDFFVDRVQPDTETKIYDTDVGGSCQITMAASASPVSMMSLQAAGYDGAIAVDWVTGSELDHAGFNVYRADAPGTGLVQINRTLIRNFSSSVLGHGRYRFVDTRVENERPYFYYVEDVATNGRRTLHGPASATPRASAGPVPSSPGETNSDTSGSGGETGSDGTPSSGGITNGSRVDLGNGVHILAQTRRSLRLEIIPPAATLSPSAWNPAYKTLTLPGYSSTMEPGKPELAERTLLIEVDRDLLSATVSGSSLQETLPGTEMIAPAPAWAPDASGRLTPSWSIDPRAYESTSYGPSSYFELTPALETIGNRRYLRLKVMPFAFQPAPGLLKSAARIVLDLSFEAAAPPDLPTGLLPAELPLSPSAFENTLRIRIKRNGLHELTHEDLATLGLESAFSGADTSAFRLYYQGNELPLEIRSATGRFLPGDSLRFPALHRRSVGDAEDELVLSPFALPGSTGAPLRITPLNADPTGLPHSTEPGTWRSATAELDSYPMFDSPLGTLVDHLYWGRIFAEKDREPTAAASLTLPIELPALDVESPDPVRLRLYVKGGSGFAENPTHHLGIFVNHVPFIVAEASFASQEPQELRLEIPAAFFHAGSNRVRVQALADQVPDGDWDIVYVDRLDAEYRAHRTALDGLAEIQNYRLDHALTVGGFTDPFSIAAYDVTDVYQVRKLILPEPALETVSTHSVTFAASGGAGGLLGRRFTVLQDSAVLKPSALLLGRGSALPLNSSLQGADLLVVGSVPLLAAASELITAREAEGLRVVTVTPEQLYAEFSHGRRTAEALRGLIEFARAHWLPPAPRYLLILGDATYDPQNRLGFQTSPALMQMPLERGLYMDFGSDHWFVESGLSGLPGLAVGRIPTDDPDELLGYVRKLLDYESGARAPDSFSANRLVFVSDADTLGEGFASQSDALARSALASRAAFQTTRLDRQAAGSDGALRSAILDTFEQGPLAITYLGHGAEDRWAGPEVFANADADALAHSRLPIVVALNCLNGYFYDADPAFHGLGEKLLLNPDGGAIAFWGSTAMTLPTAQVSLARAFLDRLGHETRQSYHPARLGDLAVQAKTAVGFSPVTADALRSYTLLGDPTLRLPRSAFATAAPAPSPSISSGSGDDDGGIFGCGTVSTGGRGPGSSASGRGAAEFAIFIVLLCLARQLARRKSAIHPGWQR